MTCCRRRRCLPVACAAAASLPSLARLSRAPGPARRVPRPRRLFGRGGNTRAVPWGPLSRRRRPPHWGTPGTAPTSGGGDPGARSGCPPAEAPPRPGQALLRAVRRSPPPALARPPARPLTLSPAPSCFLHKPTTPARSAFLPEPRSRRRDVTSVTSSEGRGSGEGAGRRRW